MKIKKIIPREILDSAGEWTVEVKIILKDGSEEEASVPSGISEGQWEAKTVLAGQAVKEISEIIFPAVRGKELSSQKALDSILQNLSCGANSTLAVSLAFSRAAKTLVFPKKKVLPQSLMLIFEGAKHGSKSLNIQEFMVVVKRIEDGVDAYHKVKDYLEKQNLPVTVGAEGGFSPPGLGDEEVLGILKKVLGGKMKLALDVAADFHQEAKFDYHQLVEDYPIVLLEDPYSDDDWGNWTNLTSSKIGNEVIIVGDDLTATSPARINEAAKRKAVSGVIIKPDQRKTLTEVVEAVEVAKEKGLKIVVSHRGRETNDTFIADLAIAVQADYVKFGAPVRGERVAKYNRLLVITKEEFGQRII